MQNSEFCIRITNLYESHTSPVILCFQNRVISTRIASPYGSQPSSVVFACKTASFGPELQVSIGTSGFWIQNSDFWSRITTLYGSQTTPVLSCMQIIVIITRITSFYGFQPSSVVLRFQNSDLKTKIACVYGFQTSLVIFCMQNCVPSIRITSLFGFQPPFVSSACKSATSEPE